MYMEPAIRGVDGMQIRFAEAGPGGGETVLLTCPWPESLFAFRKLWARLAERFHLVAIDLPGFGRSEGRMDLFSPSAMGVFLVRLAREWRLDPVHLVGPAAGTTAALVAAARAPGLVGSLVVGAGATAVPLQVSGRLKDIIAAPDLAAFRHVDVNALFGPVYDAIPGGSPLPAMRADYLASYAGERWAESTRYVRSYPTELPTLAQQLPGIPTPIQIVSGADDLVVPLANAEFLHARLPCSSLRVLPPSHFA